MKYIILFLTVILGCISCQKEDVPVYNAGRYVQFVTDYTDSMNYSFFFFPGQKMLKVPLPVKLVGHPLKQATMLSLQAVTRLTTADAGQYDLPSPCEFQANHSGDTLYLTLKDVNLTRPVRLVVDIVDGDFLLAGQSAFTRKIVWFSAEVSRPLWWTAGSEVEEIFLGPYTEKKFRKFMEVTGVGDLTGLSYDQKRTLALEFKRELLRLREAGTPYPDEDGSDMSKSVPVVGF